MPIRFDFNETVCLIINRQWSRHKRRSYKTLNRELKDQKTLALSSLLKLQPIKTEFEQLSEVICEIYQSEYRE